MQLAYRTFVLTDEIDWPGKCSFSVSDYLEIALCEWLKPWTKVFLSTLRESPRADSVWLRGGYALHDLERFILVALWRISMKNSARRYRLEAPLHEVKGKVREKVRHAADDPRLQEWELPDDRRKLGEGRFERKVSRVEEGTRS